MTYETIVNGVKKQDDIVQDVLSKAVTTTGWMDKLPLPIYSGTAVNVGIVTTQAYITEGMVNVESTHTTEGIISPRKYIAGVNPLYLLGKMDNTTEEKVKSVLTDAVMQAMSVNETDEVKVSIQKEEVIGENG